MKKIISIAIVILAITNSINAQIVNIPDANFKAYLVGNTNINTNGDTEIQVSEANSCTEVINIYNLGITDLTGIEAFISITKLYCDNNQLTSIDISANTALEELFCNTNQLTTLDISMNSSLNRLHCANNQLTSLDPSNNTSLRILDCNNNQLTAIDISQLDNLTWFHCSLNAITSLDFSSNDSLTHVGCHDNQLTTLDFSTNENLNILKCYANNLNSLNIANGDNGPYLNFQAFNNPDLFCIQVDDVQFAVSNMALNIDPQVIFSLDCSTGTEEYTIDPLTIYPNPVQNILHIDKANTLAEGIEIINLSGTTIAEIPENADQIDVSHLQSGVYLLRYIADNNLFHRRFVKD